MARGRMISKSLSTSEKFAALVEYVPTIAEFCHALYPLLVIHTDDFGRLQGDPFTVKALCYPASPRPLAEFSHALQALHDVTLLTWYAVDNKGFIQITVFERHQQGLHKRTRSAFPRVPGSSGNDEEFPGQEKGRELKRRELKIPLTPLKGGRERRTNERRGSQRRRKAVIGGAVCTHDVRCDSTAACIARTIADGRKAKAS